MDKLQEIKERYVNSPVIEHINGIDIIAMDKKDKDWLISTVEEQQKEIDELNRINSVMDDDLVRNGKEIMRLTDEKAELDYQNKRYREAIEKAKSESAHRIGDGVMIKVYEILNEALESEQ